MSTIEFNVPAVPVAQPRQRHRLATGAGGKSFVKNYTPAKSPVNDYKATVRHAAAAEHKGAPLQGPLYLSLTFIMPRPKGMYWKTKPMPRVPHASRPDCDNLAKSTLDALKGLLWIDDAQISRLDVHKLVADGHEQPSVFVYCAALAASEPEKEGEDAQ